MFTATRLEVSPPTAAISEQPTQDTLIFHSLKQQYLAPAQANCLLLVKMLFYIGKIFFK